MGHLKLNAAQLGGIEKIDGLYLGFFVQGGFRGRRGVSWCVQFNCPPWDELLRDFSF